jgi:nucleotide-binding universal stress UspA family protein
MFNSILISLDGSPESEAVLPVIEKILSFSPANVVLLRVAPEVNYIVATREYATNLGSDLATDKNALYATKEHEMATYLNQIGDRLKAAGAKTVTLAYSFNDPVDEILSRVKRHHVDLIAMATHGREGLNRLVHGSTTESVLHHAPCPMLVVRTGSV